MVRRAAFWFFLVLLAVGFGWAANEQWRLPFVGLFNWQADQQEALPEPDADPDAGRSAESPESVVAAAPPAVPKRPVPEPAIPEPAGSPAASAEAAASAGAPSIAPRGAPANEQPRQPPETAIAVVEPGDPPASDTGPAPPTGDAAPAAMPEAAQTAAPTAAGPQAETGPASDVAPAAGPAGAAAKSDAGAHDTPRKNSVLQQTAAIPQPLPGGQATITPTFDIVRVERDGRAVIAGRAEPGAEVVVRSGEQVIDRVRASPRGEWVAIPTRPLSPGDQQLSAVARRDGAPAIRSDQVVVIAVPDPAPTQPAPGQAAAAKPPVAVLLPRDGKGPGRILQAPGGLSAEDTLALMTVSYDESGKVLLSGEAPPGVPVRIYVDNRPAALVVGDVKGAWASSLDDTLAPGTYTLRLDQLDDQGQPVARIETPLTRVSDPPIEGELQVDYVVVQPGNSLWRIARRLSGKGLDYLHIYDTNQSQIRDPDLIYPGQVFEIPTEVGSAG